MALEKEHSMTTRYTQAEWGTIINEAEKDIPSSFPEYKAPILGTPDFASCIDHTLLKLDANKDQIDELCEEARRHQFRVRTQISRCSDGRKLYRGSSGLYLVFEHLRYTCFVDIIIQNG